MLFRWYVGLSPDDLSSHLSIFTNNRYQLLNNDFMSLFLEKLIGTPEDCFFLSDEHSVDGESKGQRASCTV